MFTVQQPKQNQPIRFKDIPFGDSSTYNDGSGRYLERNNRHRENSWLQPADLGSTPSWDNV
jgi:hypothetical protein